MKFFDYIAADGCSDIRKPFTRDLAPVFLEPKENSMAWAIQKSGFFLLILCVTLVFYGCDGSEPRQQVDDTVKEISGQKNVERMDQILKDIDTIQSKQADRLKKFEESIDK